MLAVPLLYVLPVIPASMCHASICALRLTSNDMRTSPTMRLILPFANSSHVHYLLQYSLLHPQGSQPVST